MPDYIIRQYEIEARPRPKPRGRGRGRGRGQSFETEANFGLLASRPLWPRGLNITDLYSLRMLASCITTIKINEHLTKDNENVMYDH